MPISISNILYTVVPSIPKKPRQINAGIENPKMPVTRPPAENKPEIIPPTAYRQTSLGSPELSAAANPTAVPHTDPPVTPPNRAAARIKATVRVRPNEKPNMLIGDKATSNRSRVITTEVNSSPLSPIPEIMLVQRVLRTKYVSPPANTPSDNNKRVWLESCIQVTRLQTVTETKTQKAQKKGFSEILLRLCANIRRLIVANKAAV